jgi:hypothetical protein
VVANNSTDIQAQRIFSNDLRDVMNVNTSKDLTSHTRQESSAPPHRNTNVGPQNNIIPPVISSFLLIKIEFFYHV